MKKLDFRVTGGGSVYMVEPVSRRAKKWVEQKVSLESWQWLGPAFAVDHRYIDTLIDAIDDDGFNRQIG